MMSIKCPECDKFPIKTKHGLMKHLTGNLKYGGHGKSLIDAEEMAGEVFSTDTDNIQKKESNAYLLGSKPLGNDLGPSYPLDGPFKAKARLQQSQFRCEVLKVGYDRFGSCLNEDDAKKGMNFYDGFGVFSAVRDYQKKYSQNLYANMLRSQHIPFNFFIPLRGDYEYAKRIFNQWFNGSKNPVVKQVTKIIIEHAPTPKEEHLDDRTAFDAFIEYTHVDGAQGFIGIEVKFTENCFSRLGQKEKRDINDPNGRYWSITNKCGIYNKEANLELLKGDDIRQIWRNQLLGESILLNSSNKYQHSTSIVLHPKWNEDATKACNKYSEHLNRPYDLKFKNIVFEDFIGKCKSEAPSEVWKKWVEYLERRYLIC